MTPLSRCDLRERSRRILHLSVLVKSCLLLGMAVGLGLVVAHLRFRTRDLQIESSKLQKRIDSITSYKRSLISQVEELKRYERLRQYAETHFGLREHRPFQSAKVALSPEAVERWNAVLAALPRERLAPEPTGRRLLAAVGGKIVAWSSVSMAGEAPEPGR